MPHEKESIVNTTWMILKQINKCVWYSGDVECDTRFHLEQKLDKYRL